MQDVEMVRILKYLTCEVKFPDMMWAEQVTTAIYILNRTGKSSKKGVTCHSHVILLNFIIILLIILADPLIFNEMMPTFFSKVHPNNHIFELKKVVFFTKFQ